MPGDDPQNTVMNFVGSEEDEEDEEDVVDSVMLRVLVVELGEERKERRSCSKNVYSIAES